MIQVTWEMTEVGVTYKMVIKMRSLEGKDEACVILGVQVSE